MKLGVPCSCGKPSFRLTSITIILGVGWYAVIAVALNTFLVWTGELEVQPAIIEAWRALGEVRVSFKNAIASLISAAGEASSRSATAFLLSSISTSSSVLDAAAGSDSSFSSFFSDLVPFCIWLFFTDVSLTSAFLSGSVDSRSALSP